MTYRKADGEVTALLSNKDMRTLQPAENLVGVEVNLWGIQLPTVQLLP